MSVPIVIGLDRGHDDVLDLFLDAERRAGRELEDRLAPAGEQTTFSAVTANWSQAASSRSTPYAEPARGIAADHLHAYGRRVPDRSPRARLCAGPAGPPLAQPSDTETQELATMRRPSGQGQVAEGRPDPVPGDSAIRIVLEPGRLHGGGRGRGV